MTNRESVRNCDDWLIATAHVFSIVMVIGLPVFTVLAIVTRTPTPRPRYRVESIHRNLIDCHAIIKRLDDDSLSVDHDACYLFERGQLFEVSHDGGRRVYHAVLTGG